MAEGDKVYCPWADEIKDDGKPLLMSRHWKDCSGNPEAKKKVIAK